MSGRNRFHLSGLASWLLLGAGALVFAVSARMIVADVIGAVDNAEGGSFDSVVARMTLNAGDRVDGINGELTFDPDLLSDPSVNASEPGASGFTADGHLVSPGVFRFILYKDPADASLSLADPVLEFEFTLNDADQKFVSTNLQFTAAAAGRIISTPQRFDVVSIAIGGPGGDPPPEIVTFGPFMIEIRSAARDWRFYR